MAKVAYIIAKLGYTGRVLLREFGTEPVVRVMVEFESQEFCEIYVTEIVDVIAVNVGSLILGAKLPTLTLQGNITVDTKYGDIVSFMHKNVCILCKYY